MDVEGGVHGAHVQQHRGRVADAGDGLIGVVGVHDGEVARAAQLDHVGVGKQEEVRHHQIAEPELLQLRETVEDVEHIPALPLHDPVHQNGEALKADVGVQLIHLGVGTAAGHGLGVHHQLMLREAEIDDPLARAGHAHHKLVGGVHIVRQIVDLPDHVFPRSEIVDGVVQTRQAGADPCLFHSCFLPCIRFFTVYNEMHLQARQK